MAGRLKEKIRWTIKKGRRIEKWTGKGKRRKAQILNPIIRKVVKRRIGKDRSRIKITRIEERFRKARVIKIRIN
jgi:hypothetical protein